MQKFDNNGERGKHTGRGTKVKEDSTSNDAPAIRV